MRRRAVPRLTVPVPKVYARKAYVIACAEGQFVGEVELTTKTGVPSVTRGVSFHQAGLFAKKQALWHMLEGDRLIPCDVTTSVTNPEG